ncbi:MAG: dienelactone hydrolase family protein [Hyphomicrobiales bacterium]|nr:MAG: dienelactone hydrolase family protein [Hyphomicrobiales bacterium]
MGQRITLTASDGFTLNAYTASPEGKPRGGVVVFGEVWGLNHWVRSVVDRWAAHGYFAVAPAMFDRVDFGYESENYGQDQFKIIGKIFETYSQESALLDMQAAVDAAKIAGKVGVTGYCFGGANSWRAAAQVRGVAAASGYYGGGVPNYIGLTPKAPIEMHFADSDTGIPLEQVEDLKRAHPGADIYTYAGQHGFCNSDRPDRFDEAACTKASARSLNFFHKHLD